MPDLSPREFLANRRGSKSLLNSLLLLGKLLIVQRHHPHWQQFHDFVRSHRGTYGRRGTTSYQLRVCKAKGGFEGQR